jgi:hypothetical protein
MLQYGFLLLLPECNTDRDSDIPQDVDLKTLAKISGVRAIRPSLYYKAPKSVFKYLIKFSIYAYNPRRPVKMKIISRDASIPVDTESTHTMTVSSNWFQPCLS